MIRNTSRDRPHKKKPYHRVQVPPELAKEIDRIVGLFQSCGERFTTGYCNHKYVKRKLCLPRRHGRLTKNKRQDLRGCRASLEGGAQASTPNRQASPLRSRTTENSVGFNLDHTIISSLGTSNTRQLDNDAIRELEVAYCIATKSESRASLKDSPEDHTTAMFELEEVNIGPPQLLTLSRTSPTLHPVVVPSKASSSRHQVLASGHSSTVTRTAIVDVEQLKLDLREVFEEFLARANTVVDRHIQGLQ